MLNQVVSKPLTRPGRRVSLYGSVYVDPLVPVVPVGERMAIYGRLRESDIPKVVCIVRGLKLSGVAHGYG